MFSASRHQIRLIYKILPGKYYYNLLETVKVLFRRYSHPTHALCQASRTLYAIQSQYYDPSLSVDPRFFRKRTLQHAGQHNVVRRPGHRRAAGSAILQQDPDDVLRVDILTPP